jgi:ABC-2 type transport system permease protein
MNHLPHSSTVLFPQFNISISKINIPNYIQEIFVLIIRLSIQVWRRPSLTITGIIQPLLWLIIFGALFQNAPIEIFTSTTQYKYFISAGIIVFTTFTNSLNAGLPLIFDREFGFLNRLLVTPISSRYSIIISLSINITFITSLQVISIIYSCYLIGYSPANNNHFILITKVLLLLSNSITNFSLMLAFIVPGHVELLASIIIINLPLLFSSTALAPLIFMPSWLQIIASINPLSYAIETIRYAYFNTSYNLKSIIIQTAWGSVNLLHIFMLFIIINVVSFIYIKHLISNKFEE